jgi:ketosteroid isomerase-like protein
VDTVKEQLVALYTQWMEAIQRNDMETLEELLGDEYIYTASGQGRWSRQTWLQTVPDYDITRFELRELDVQVHGDVAVALPVFWQEAIVYGSPRSGEFLITDVWVRREGRWQVIARSSILAAAAK